jgi:hypothetical protein
MVTVQSGVRTSNLSVTGPTVLTGLTGEAEEEEIVEEDEEEQEKKKNMEKKKK